MKKAMKFLVILLAVIALVGCGKKNDNNNNNNNVPPINKQVDNTTAIKQGDLEFRNIKITSFGSTNKVTATVTNTGTKTLSFKAVLYMKNSDKRTLGKVDTTISKLASKAATDISLEIMGDYSTINTFEVVVENLVSE